MSLIQLMIQTPQTEPPTEVFHNNRVSFQSRKISFTRPGYEDIWDGKDNISLHTEDESNDYIGFSISYIEEFDASQESFYQALTSKIGGSYSYSNNRWWWLAPYVPDYVSVSNYNGNIYKDYY